MYIFSFFSSKRFLFPVKKSNVTRDCKSFALSRSSNMHCIRGLHIYSNSQSTGKYTRIILSQGLGRYYEWQTLHRQQIFCPAYWPTGQIFLKILPSQYIYCVDALWCRSRRLSGCRPFSLLSQHWTFDLTASMCICLLRLIEDVRHIVKYVKTYSILQELYREGYCQCYRFVIRGFICDDHVKKLPDEGYIIAVQPFHFFTCRTV